jgi:HAD superfamily hydrolase (TIGR01549 family)
LTIIFDLDGTLVDTIELHARTFVQAFMEDGKEVSDAEVKSLVGFSARDIIARIGTANPEKVLARKVELFVQQAHEAEEIEGASRVIGELKARGHRVCIATSSNRAMTEIFTKKFGWPVDMVVTADDVERGKPAPDMLLKILESFPGRAVFIGDSKYDREAAAAAGIPALILGEDFRKLEELLEMDL